MNDIKINDIKMTSVELRASWSLALVFAFRMLGMFMVLPVLTTYGMTLHSASKSLIGFAIGIYGLAQAIFQIPFGLVSDRIGRKPLIVGGLLVFSLGSVVAALTDNIWGVIIGRALQGSGAITAAIMALLSDLTREQNRTKAMAFIGVSFGITFLIAMTIGPIITHAIGLNGLFWCISVLALVSIALILLVVPTASEHILNRESGIVPSNIGKVLANLQLLKLNISIFCLHSIMILSFIALPSMMAEAGFFPGEQWKVYLITMLISFFIVVPTIIYAEVKRHIKRIFLGCVRLLLFAELVLLALRHYLWGIFLGVQLFFIAFNIMEAILPSLISKESPAGHKGTAMGIYSTSQFLGVAFGGTLGGFFFQLQGAWLIFLTGAAIALALWSLSTTLNESPYVSSLRIDLSNLAIDESQLVQRLQTQPGVKEVLVVPEEHSAYIKVDTTQTNRAVLEREIVL